MMIISAIFMSILYLFSPIPQKKATDITIKDSSLSSVVSTLSDAGIIKHPYLFYSIASLYEVLSGKHCTSGTFTVQNTFTHARIIKLIYSGEEGMTVNVVIPEGSDLRRIASILQKRITVDSLTFIRLVNNDSICASMGVKQTSMEGYCMPDTYNFYKKQKATDIIKKLAVIHQLFWDKQCAELQKQSKYSKHEILTLASIIEAEASVASERQRISGVYHNRLLRGMKLEADPTVQYAIGKRKRLFYSDLRTDSKYNTYKYAGLPPGPINCPGRESILAALQPEQHGYIFFVAKGDGTGEHVFTNNGRDHAKAVNAYRKQRTM
ncbi:MAG: endolytic transglycosylase MltG [Ignavibacteria bacterium]